MYTCPISKRFTLLSLTWAVGLFFTAIGCGMQWQTPESNAEINSLQTQETARPLTLIRTIIGYVKHGLKRTTSQLLRALDEDDKRPKMQPQVLRREGYCRFVPQSVVVFMRR